MNSTLLNILISTVLGAVLPIGEKKLGEILDDVYTKSPKKAQAVTGIVYNSAKGFAEDLAAGTSIPYDDQAVAALEDECMQFAQSKGFELQKFV